MLAAKKIMNKNKMKNFIFSQLSTKLKTDVVPPECKSLVYSHNELYMLDSPNNTIKVFSRGRHWTYFRSIIPRGMDVCYSKYPKERGITCYYLGNAGIIYVTGPKFIYLKLLDTFDFESG